MPGEKMTDIDSFKTRTRANDGIRINLFHPDGTPSEHWIQVRSVWSDDYQEARMELIRQAVEDGRRAANAEGDAAVEIRRESERKRRAVAAASLVAGWSFDLEFTRERVIDFLLEAPQILSHVERIAEDDRRFFGKEFANSPTGEGRN